MNGIVTGQAFHRALYALAEDTRVGVWTVEGFTAELAKLQAKLTLEANRTMESAVVEALTEFQPNQKIQLIKKIRELTGSGIKEAKDALEAALPGILVKRIEALYGELREANSRVGWNVTRYPDQSHMNADPTNDNSF